MGKLIDSDKVKEYLDEIEKELTNNMISIVRENYIHKADYEARLKADLKAILVELQLEIEKIAQEEKCHDSKWALGLKYSEKVIQETINKLKEQEDGTN